MLMNLIHVPQAPAVTKESGPAAEGRSRWLAGGLALAGLTTALAWSYWPTLEKMADRWNRDPQYSHGFLVPIFAGLILWVRRPLFGEAVWQPTWWGLPLLVVGAGLRVAAAFRDIELLAAMSLLPTLVGLVLLVGGWSMVRWSWPAQAFLVFMIPLPYQFEIALSHPLRAIATRSSTFLLQLLGYPALHEGNVILIEDIRLGVIDACSGLGMLMTFFALATAMAFLVKAPLGDRLLLFVSAIPIAIVANVLRIVGTGIAYIHLDSETAHAIMHDLAGWLMMPIALGILWFESWYLSWLFPVQAPAQPLAILFPAMPLALPGPPTSSNGPTSSEKHS